ncbi:hypothetical protein [uncultured Ezakiella sp.]|uniref:hypothetical protein n=1 Tax=uncultured Ezakiella sp. TaxID=1637529 RepID=UPI0025FF54E3|nr:hypothetical protein [uncultured Ezakiella sp.]
MRKTLSIVLSLLMVLSIFAPVFAEEEVTAENIAKNEEFIEFLKEQKIIEGDKSGNLMLEENIDRASFAAILVRADGKDAVAKSVATLPSKFADMNAAHWANGYATVAMNNLWMKGNPANEFMPGKQISYAEIATTLVRFLNEEGTGFVYPTSYIAKATELGLFEGTNDIAGEYNKNATRKNVFMMLYNAISREDFGKYNVYKMIVLENNRVAQLGVDQIKTEVLSVVQMANNVNERGVAKVGEQMVFDIKDVKVEGGLADTENLIGKVANFTVDQNDKLVKVVVDDKNYEYYWGGFNASADGKTFSIAGKKFNVRFDERYYRQGDGLYNIQRYDRDDRVYRTYVTNSGRAENYNYIDFAHKLDAETINANFARVTVKDGMVLFVDAYNYTDIAPVQKVERDGSDVYYWNDARDAAVERMTPARRVIGYTAKDGFRNITKSDIKADDTIHWMDGLTLVRQDAKLDSNLVKTYINKWGEYAVLKLAEDKTDDFYLRSKYYEKTPLQSVFAYDDNHFRRLDSRAQIDDMVGADVKVLLDVFGDIQLITSHEKFTDRLALVNKVVSAKGMQFYLPNAPEEAQFRLTDSWDSEYYRYGWNKTQTRRFDYFNRLDLVYTAADKDGNANTVATIDGFAYNTKDHPYQYDGKGKAWDYAAFIDARRDFVRVGSKDYRYTDETDVFVINVDPRTGNRDYVISKVTLADVKKYNKNNTDLMAAVLTEKEYADFLDKIDVATWGRYNDARDDFAKAIIFTNYRGPQADLEKPEIGRIARIDNYSNVVEIEVSRGMFEEFKIASGSAVNMRNRGLIGEYVEFRRVKDSDPKAARFDAIIEATDEGEVTRRTAYTITIDKATYKTDVNTKEFGDSRLDHAWVYVRGGYADLIVYTKPGEAPALKLEPKDYVDYNLFKAALAAAQTAKPTDADYATKVKAALDAYEDLTDAAKKLLVKEEEKKALDALEDTVPAVKFQADYDKALKALYDFNKKIKAKAEKNITTDEEYKEAKGLLEVYDAYAKVTGIDTTKGINDNTDSAIRATTDGLIKAYEKSIEDDKTAAAQKRVNAYRDSEARRIANEFARVMNNYTDEVNAKKAVKDKIDAVNKAISDLEKEKFTLADASEEDAKKAEVDLEISKINQLIAAYKAEAAKQLRLKS